ncbi:hypothetical protein DPMN_141080 [Dreissena polymorpha]|uniref:Uncharacterized protein n=1 Tax=Dreissena polymorpha TaxID=45954 RepID=A0A9D4JJK3_DREPO|nr:hypothetical protein DPMN_141080 [Dreissena polymorpha]
MMDNSPEFYNPSYKTDKLKNKLLREFQGQIQFWQPNYRSELVYSSNILKGQAVETAFELAASDERVVEDCAMMLRRNILDFKEGQSFSEWPPRASNLLSMSKNMPCLLEHFLTVLLCGKMTRLCRIRPRDLLIRLDKTFVTQSPMEDSNCQNIFCLE